jgi:hypothetical protein
MGSSCAKLNVLFAAACDAEKEKKEEKECTRILADMNAVFVVDDGYEGRVRKPLVWRGTVVRIYPKRQTALVSFHTGNEIHPLRHLLTFKAALATLENTKHPARKLIKKNRK